MANELGERESYILTLEAEPEDPLVSDTQLQEAPHSSRGEPPEKRQRKEKNKGQDGYEDLVRKETERAEKQITLAEEQIKLTLLQQRETKLCIRLFEERLKNNAVPVLDEEAWHSCTCTYPVFFCKLKIFGLII